MNIQEVFTHAKEDLLAEGKHAPVMYVEYRAEGRNYLDYFYFANFGAETPTEERMQFFTLGVKWGNEHPDPLEFTALTFISEAWMSSVAPGVKPSWKRPRDDPNRREALIAQVVTVMPTPGGKPEMKQALLRAEIVRPSPDTIDLVPDETKVQVTRLLFPGYFLAGYAASQCEPAELAQIMREVLG